ncbi:ABC transporter ATP-binding protein [Roseibium sp.]|uniref:ABC transporter ATP-binding protein n=1 Tax=Roseibium sp. TaxID=1936156 RepID=UPI003BA9C18F
MTPVRNDGAPIVSLSGLAKTFANGTRALDGLDLEIRRGEFLSLLGPSGCGKSTLLRVLAGLEQPSGGTVTWDGAAGGQSAHDLGFVFQEPTLLPWATVRGNVHFPLRTKNVPVGIAKDRIDGVLERVGLERFADSYPHELSGGMKMRVSIARALVTEPKVLLMDEPFAALDEITRFKLNADLLRVWQASELTVVFVTHSVFESVFLSERIAVMRGSPGRLSDEISIDPALIRDERFRTSSDYAGLCRQVSDALHATMAGEGAGV